MEQSFYAYPSAPSEIGHPIEEAITSLNTLGEKVLSWRAMDIFGNFIPKEIVDQIQERVFIADITRLNCNVTYELGYAIGTGQKILLTKNSSIVESHPTILEVGIFDTIGYIEYANSSDLSTLLKRAKGHVLFPGLKDPNNSAPVYILETKHKTDFFTRITARIKKARLMYRSFDPNESPRLSANEAIEQVAQSHGVVVSLLNSDNALHEIHNIRAAFIAGLAVGMNKVRLFIQYGAGAIPMDYRDLVTVVGKIEHIDRYVSEFSQDVVESLQTEYTGSSRITTTPLEKLDLGASAAENEMKTLKYYYLRTDAFNKAMRGEVQLVVGRKGSGKTAIFLQIRDSERSKIQNIVLDLKPDGYKLIKFKEVVLDYLEEGTFQHTIMAFWEYILLLELCHKTLEADKKRVFSDLESYKTFKKFDDLYNTAGYANEGDFSERMSGMINKITRRFQDKFGQKKNIRFSDPEVTELIYEVEIKLLRDHLAEYLVTKKNVWLLFDNLDKGWPASGLTHQDALIIRTLIDASKKIQRFFERQHINVLPIVFLRNDVYAWLVEESPDRQKEAKVLLDWTDPDLLRQVIRLRILANPEMDNTHDLEQLWRRICVGIYEGEDSLQYLIERSLMRPRFLLNLISHCRGTAVNLNHNKIKEEDITKGLSLYSADLLTDISLEMRDIIPHYEDILFAFLNSKKVISKNEICKKLEGIFNSSEVDRALDMLLWYGFLGVGHDNEVKFIYSTNYSMKLLKGLIDNQGNEVVFTINPAFWPALMIKN